VRVTINRKRHNRGLDAFDGLLALVRKLGKRLRRKPPPKPKKSRLASNKRPRKAATGKVAHTPAVLSFDLVRKAANE